MGDENSGAELRGGPTPSPTSFTLNRVKVWLALAGLLAGLAAFGVGEAVYELIPAERVKTNTMGHSLMTPTAATTAVADVRNAGLTFGLLGVCLGGLMGVAGGLARRSVAAISVAGLLGAIVGMATAAGAAFGLLPYFFDTQPYHPEYEMILSMIMHASIWGLTGAAAGLAFAVGSGEWRLLPRAMAAGFVGAVFGAVCFELIGAAICPLASTGQPVSTTWPTRLLARLMVAIATVALVILSLPSAFPAGGPPPREVPPPNPS